MNFVWKSVLGFVFLLFMTNAADIRLKQNIQPKFYWITITPDFEKATFEGSVIIDIEVGDYMENITLHAKHIVPDKIILTQKGDDTAMACSASMDKDNELMIVRPTDLIYKNNYKLFISYTGKIQDEMLGFYRSYYFDNGGEKRWLGTTQFEATSARSAFPCFDEPRFRAGFNVTFILPQNYSVISNTKLTSKTPRDKLVEHNFATYPTMPTYLLGWIIYDPRSFIGTTGVSKDGIEYRVWAQEKFSNQSKFAADIAPTLLSSLAKFTGVPYKINGKIEKMDQIAVPDFNAGAMENWGLVTYRENRLLYDSELSTTEAKRSIMMVIAHEFTHQWFGNLVTLDWWSSTWLNEAFARYFQYFIAAKEFPEWKLEEDFVVNAVQVALDYDSNPTHPMTSEIIHHNNISAIFDVITYSKGASIVAMMEHTLSPETFQKGLTNYLTVKGKKSNQVATPDDLFMLVQMAQSPEGRKKMNFRNVFKTWTENSGFPLITVTRDYKTGSAQVEQERFYYDQTLNDTKTWHVPLTYTVEAVKNFSDISVKEWLTPENPSINISKLGTNGWVIFNIQHKGFYRVNYDEENWKKIIQQLKKDHSVIGVLNRAQLIDDSFSLARAGILNYTIAFDITSYLKNEKEYVPWVAAIRNFRYILKHFYQSAEHEKLMKYFLKLISPAVNDVAFKENEKESVVTKLKRIAVLSFAAKVEHNDCQSNAAKIAKTLGQTESKIEFSADVQRALLCRGVESNDVTVWRQLFNRLGKLKSPTQENDFIVALTCTKDPVSIKEYLNKTIIQNSVIRKQDAKTVFAGLSSSHVGASETIKFVSNNYKALIEYNHGNDKIVSDMIRGASDQIYQQTELAEIRTLTKNMTSILKESTIGMLNSTIKKIEKNFEWRMKYWDGIRAWLRENEIATETPPTSSGTSATPTKPPISSSTSKPSSANLPSSSQISVVVSVVCIISMTHLNNWIHLRAK